MIFNANLVDPVKPVSATIYLIIYFPVSSTVLVFGTSQRHRPLYGTRHFDFRHEVAANIKQQFSDSSHLQFWQLAVFIRTWVFLWCCNYDFNVQFQVVLSGSGQGSPGLP